MNTTHEDLAHVAWMDEQAGQAEFEERRQYEAWLAARLEDGYSLAESSEEDWSDELVARAEAYYE